MLLIFVPPVGQFHFSLENPFPLVGEVVNEPLSKAVRILDYDKTNCFATDDEVKEYLTERYGLKTPADIQLLTKDRRDGILHDIKEYGATIRQLERLTGIGFSSCTF